VALLPLLIVPEGIEMMARMFSKAHDLLLLIVPEGIEIRFQPARPRVLESFNRTRRN